MNTQFLKTELLKRLEKNPQYSVRSFAKSLGIHVGTLSAILNGKRPLTIKAANEICNKLGLSPKEKAEILKNAAQDKRVKANQNQKALSLAKKDKIELDQEMFRVVSDWYHYGILQVIRTDDYLKDISHATPNWIAKKLKISVAQAKLAIESLFNLKLVTQNENGFLVRTNKMFTTADKSVTTGALKKLQKQIREKAITSLMNDPIETRSMTSMTMAINPEKIAEAKKLIEEFETNLSEFLEEGRKESVYQLSISLFPLKGDV